VLPLLDWCIGSDESNPPESAARALEADSYYQRLVLAVAPLQLLATMAGAWVAASLAMSWLGLLGLVLTVGCVNGFGIVAAHELGHKKSRFAQRVAKLQLALAAYGHFLLNATAATTAMSPRRWIRPVQGWVKAFGNSCHARCGAACARPGRWGVRACKPRVKAAGVGATTFCKPGRQPP
jgi:hypothetical protein